MVSRARGSDAALMAETRTKALAIATDVDAVHADPGTREQRAMREATPEAVKG